MAKNYRSFRVSGKNIVKPSKHQASKKNFQHKHNLSLGELNHKKFLARELVKNSPNVNEYLKHPELLD